MSTSGVRLHSDEQRLSKKTVRFSMFCCKSTLFSHFLVLVSTSRLSDMTLLLLLSGKTKQMVKERKGII